MKYLPNKTDMQGRWDPVDTGKVPVEENEWRRGESQMFDGGGLACEIDAMGPEESYFWSV
jgi:hypothetical protein